MPYSINRAILGISDIIGAKSWPTNPSAFGDSGQFTYDLREELLGSQATAAGFGVTLNAIAAFQATNVPDSEAWYVWNISAYSNQLVAGNTLGMACFYNVRAGAGGVYPFYGPASLVLTSAVPGGPIVTATFQPNAWVGPGMAIGVNAFSFAGANIGASVVIHYARIRL